MTKKYRFLHQDNSEGLCEFETASDFDAYPVQLLSQSIPLLAKITKLMEFHLCGPPTRTIQVPSA